MGKSNTRASQVLADWVAPILVGCGVFGFAVLYLNDVATSALAGPVVLLVVGAILLLANDKEGSRDAGDPEE